MNESNDRLNIRQLTEQKTHKQLSSKEANKARARHHSNNREDISSRNDYPIDSS